MAREKSIDGTKSEALYVRQLSLGPMENHVYLLGAAQSPDVAVIDPAWDVPAIVRAAREDGKRIAAALLTHHHADHTNGLGELLDALDIPAYAQKEEIEFAPSLAAYSNALRAVGPGEVISVGPLSITCLLTPGHTPGSTCFLANGALFSGDTLFVNACGRCDLPGSDPAMMFNSLHHVLGALPDETRVYPGHDYGDQPTSTMGRERARNPYLQLRELSEFLKGRARPRA